MLVISPLMERLANWTTGLNLILANLGITVWHRYDNVIRLPSVCVLCVEKTACTLIASPSILVFSPEVKSYKLKDFFVSIWLLGHKLRQGEETHGAEEWSAWFMSKENPSKAEWESGSIKINSLCLTDLHGISTCLPHFFKYEFHLFPASPCTSSEKPILGGNGFKAHTPDVPNAPFENKFGLNFRINLLHFFRRRCCCSIF